MRRFAFVIHPLNARQAARRYPIARWMPDGWIESLLAAKKPFVVSSITGIQSLTGETTEGWFIGCPLTPNMMVNRLRLETVYDRIGECVRIGAAEGAEIAGLGAFTSVVGDGGVTIAERASIAVTTGNSYTVATAIDGTLEACRLLDMNLRDSTLAVVGATGSIGRTCARILGPSFGKTILVGRDQARMEEVAAEIPHSWATTQVEALREADAVVTVTSSEVEIIHPQHLKAGALVCDVARPRDVSTRVSRERPDVLVIEGGVVSVPGHVDFGFDFGFPPKTAYACMSETMMLALEDRIENFTIGKSVSVEQVEETRRMAMKHGFKLAGFRSFERAVDDAAIERARKARRTTSARLAVRTT